MSSLARTASRWWRAHRDKLGPLLLAALIVKFVGGTIGGIDLGVADEAFYLNAGLRLGQQPLPRAESSPLYAVWYRILAVFQPAPARLYYTNWCILQGGLAVALYALARRSGASISAALTVTTALILSQVPFVWPYVTFFSTLLLACAAIAATYPKDRLVATVVLSVALSASAFVRPELWWLSILFGTGCLAWAVRRVTSTRLLRPVAVGGAPLAVTACGRLIFGNPVGGERGLFAFSQHYALNKVEAGNLPLNPWTEHEALFRAAFPHAQTVSEAVRENPSAVLWHVGRNLGTLGSHLVEIAGLHAYVPLPRWVLVSVPAAIVALGVVGLVRARRRLPEPLLRWLPLTLPVGIAALLSSTVVYPRQHYLVPLVFFGFAVVAASTTALQLRTPKVARGFVPILLAGVLVLVPTYSPHAFPSVLEPCVTPPTQLKKHTVEALQSLDLRGKVVLLESGWSRGLYASLEFEHVPDDEKNSSFWTFVDTRHIDVLVLDHFVRDNPKFRDDPEFVAFMEDESNRRDFVLVPVTNEDAFLAVRRGRPTTAVLVR